MIQETGISTRRYYSRKYGSSYYNHKLLSLRLNVTSFQGLSFAVLLLEKPQWRKCMVVIIIVNSFVGRLLACVSVIMP